jgi:hypothetical protein
MYVLISVCHGHEFLNDVIASYIGENIHKELEFEKGIVCEVLINSLPRSLGDMNRKETRGTPFRNAVDEALDEKPIITLDVHGFPDSTDSPFKNYDIVVLISRPDQKEIAIKYFNILKNIIKDTDLKLGLLPATADNDIVNQAMEHEVPAVLIEHNESGSPELFAKIHAKAIKVIEKWGF